MEQIYKKGDVVILPETLLYSYRINEERSIGGIFTNKMKTIVSH